MEAFEMKKYLHGSIVIVFLFVSWFFGEYIYPHFARLEIYLAFILTAMIVLWMIKRRLGWRYFLIGFVCFWTVVAFFIVTSPHRTERVKMWLDMLSA